MKKIYILLFFALAFSSCVNYLDRKPLDNFDATNFWVNENNVRLYAQGSYVHRNSMTGVNTTNQSYFFGYGTGYTYPEFFMWAPWSDEFVNSSAWESTVTTTQSYLNFDFAMIRRHNIMLEEVSKMNMLADEARNHWMGIAKFFRAMEYRRMAKLFGDFPIFTTTQETTSDSLYKDRDPLYKVALQVLEDYKYAAANVRLNDGSYQINRNVVLAYMTRDLLYLGTLMKYQNKDGNGAVNACLAGCKWAAEQLIASGKFAVTDDYRAVFGSEDLTSNRDVIFSRSYADGKATHCTVSYSNGYESQSPSASQKMINTYLCSDGFPIGQSPQYNYVTDNGVRLYGNQIKNRDPRLLATYRDTVVVKGWAPGAATATGISAWKFLPYAANDVENKYFGSMNITACPLIRYSEVLLNYAEACYETGAFTQTIADATINQLRNRSIKVNNQGTAQTKLPKMVIAGNDVTVNGVAINDPARDPSVPSILWEIRRERQVELVMEGFRREDLQRWSKFSYLKTKQTDVNHPTELAYGAIFNYKVLPAATKKSIRSSNNKLFSFNADSSLVAVYNLYSPTYWRDWDDNSVVYTRCYFNSVPTNTIKFYSDNGKTLTQNPGWTN
ncbi:MAG: RagB/SusD family nutrient uptake outer membrane protein [Bacteroidales bacterium]|nr:RagB/SusD family nutrient uptake outer membrane protein [Bacteroidales bacterium]